MNVMNSMGTDADEREPTWEEALAEFNDARPAELQRSPRRISVIYRFADGAFIATSPELKGFRATGKTLREVKAATLEDLQAFLDPGVTVIEREPASDPKICTAAVTTRGSWFKSGALRSIIMPSSSGSAGKFVSSARTSRREAQVS